MRRQERPRARRACAFQSITAGVLPPRQQQVLGHRHAGRQREVLVDHADAQRARDDRVGDVLLAPVDQDAALLRRAGSPSRTSPACSCRRRSRPAARARCRARTLHRHAVQRGEAAEALGQLVGVERQRAGRRRGSMGRSGVGHGAHAPAPRAAPRDGACAPNTPPCIVIIFSAASWLPGSVARGAVRQQQALEAAVVGLAHGGVHADVGGDAGEDQVARCRACAAPARGRWRRTSPCPACR